MVAKRSHKKLPAEETARRRMNRLLAKFDTNGPNGCWSWIGSRDKQGYGVIAGAGGSRLRAHNAIYELFVGPIPEGLVLDHLCRNPSCVNPDHLEPVTTRENLMRGDTVAAKNARKTHCPKGHPYNEANTYINPTRGGRTCRTCQREYKLWWNAKQKSDKVAGQSDG